MTITLADYWMGRDDEYPLAMTPAIEHNAEIWVDVVNGWLLEVPPELLEIDPGTGSLLRSGWRPPALNAKTPGAAKASKHMSAQAGDLHDPQGRLAKWAFEHQDTLKKHGLWMEHPSATPTWLHLQTLPPGSGNRVFYP